MKTVEYERKIYFSKHYKLQKSINKSNTLTLINAQILTVISDCRRRKIEKEDDQNEESKMKRTKSRP